MNKPKFWDKINFITILLLPFSLIVSFLVYLRRKFTKSLKFNLPIICVGNIYVGGTGKTPISIFFAKEFSKLGKNPSIIRKYYKNHIDEYELIKNEFKNLIINKSRKIALQQAEKANYDLAILDDGLQDYEIKKNLNIVCFNSEQLVGNGFVFPSGPLRENLSVLKNSDIIIINGIKNIQFEKKILKINKNLEIFYSYYKPLNINDFENKKLLALAGIGNPENFFKLIEQNNLKIEKKLIFPDHYIFSEAEAQNIVREAKENKYQIIMTEKDYFKLKNYKLENTNYLKVSLEIENKEKLLKRIYKIYD